MGNESKAQLATVGLVLMAAVTVAATRGASPGDAEAIATIMAIDSAEIIHADLAMTKQLSDPVLAYVQDIRGDYADDADDIADIARDIGVEKAWSPDIRTLETEADEMVRKLDELEGPGFEKAYLDATISCQTKALAAIDRLTRMDLSEGVKAHLKDMREHVQKHLGKARALRNG
jgi:predicted outer membrane protein